jgi:hypothetical protein
VISAPAELRSFKVIAHKAGLDVKKLRHLLVERGENDNPFPIQHDRVLGWVATEEAIAAWWERERAARVPYKVALEQGRVRTRKAS